MRTVTEWIARHDDEAIPARVKLRIFDRHNRRCAECGQKPISVEYDHIRALALGGEHRETNLQPLCLPCHRAKSDEDVGRKAKADAQAKAHYGMKKRKGRPIAGTRASGIRKRMSGQVEKWT